MSAVTGAVEKIEATPRKTKMGMADVYHLWVNGEKYNLGFKRLAVPVGTVVSFDAEKGTYGWEAKSHPTPTGASVPAGSTRASGGSSSYGNKGVFPIPALDGQRSIVRQNALTNARELVTSIVNGTPMATERMADHIIEIARKFEAYTAGDLDAAEAEKEMKQATITNALKKED